MTLQVGGKHTLAPSSLSLLPNLAQQNIYLVKKSKKVYHIALK